MSRDDADLTLTRLAAVRGAMLLGEHRRRHDARIDGFADKYRPMLARLSHTEWIGLVKAIQTEIERRGPIEVVSQQAFGETLAAGPSESR